MILYADASCKYMAGWAWCTDDNRYSYGSNTAIPSNPNMAELISVVNGLRTVKDKTITVVSDHDQVCYLVNHPFDAKNKRWKRILKLWPSLVHELVSLKTGRIINAQQPQKKNKGAHGWCHHTSRKLAATRQDWD